MNEEKYAVIVAGGRGTRMGGELPKQFIEIEGKPILRHTIERFLEYDAGIHIVLVLPSDQKEYWKTYCREHDFLDRYVMVGGGITRFHSVQNALACVPEGALVAVHDGVRPFVNAQLLDRLFSAAERDGAAIPVMPVEESLREVDRERGISARADRDRFVTVQTPQVFKSSILKTAYKNAYSPTFTDDASVVEAAGVSVTLVPGLKGNIKITTPEDLRSAAFFLGGR